MAQSAHSRVISRIDEKLETAHAFQRDNFPSANAVRRGGKSARLGTSVFIEKLQARAAGGTGVRLGVETPVGGIVVFRLAVRAHREAAHRGIRAVVGQRFDDAETRAAIRAVGERVAVAAIPRIENFAQAIGAGRDVRENERGARAAFLARANAKFGKSSRLEESCFQALDESERRLFAVEPEQKFVEFCAVALDLDADALRGIQHPATQLQLAGEAVNAGAKSNALHRALDHDSGALALHFI